MLYLNGFLLEKKYRGTRVVLLLEWDRGRRELDVGSYLSVNAWFLDVESV